MFVLHLFFLTSNKQRIYKWKTSMFPIPSAPPSHGTADCQESQNVQEQPKSQLLANAMPLGVPTITISLCFTLSYLAYVLIYVHDDATLTISSSPLKSLLSTLSTYSLSRSLATLNTSLSIKITHSQNMHGFRSSFWAQSELLALTYTSTGYCAHSVFFTYSRSTLRYILPLQVVT